MPNLQETLSEFEREIAASTGMSLPRRNRLIGRGDNSWAVRIVSYAENGGTVTMTVLKMAREALGLPTPPPSGQKSAMVAAIREEYVARLKAGKADRDPIAWARAIRQRVERRENVTPLVRKMAEDAIANWERKQLLEAQRVRQAEQAAAGQTPEQAAT